MIDITDRVRNKDLQSKIVSAEEVADWVQPGWTIACSGFTASAYPKAVPLALAAAAAQRGIDLQMTLAAVAVRAVLIDHMGQIFVAEIL